MASKSDDTASEATTSSDRGGGRILLADDEDALRRMEGRILRSGGYHVVEAASGEDALRHWNENPGSIDMLITDVMMPGVGGLELARVLRSAHPGIFIIYMSGYSEGAMQGDVTQAGSTWLAKPFSPQTLLNEVRKHFGAAAPEPPS